MSDSSRCRLTLLARTKNKASTRARLSVAEVLVNYICPSSRNPTQKTYKNNEVPDSHLILSIIRVTTKPSEHQFARRATTLW